MSEVITEQQIWAPPVYDISGSPKLLSTVSLEPDAGFPGNFARSAKWSPDGSVALAHCENRSLQYLNLPTDIIDYTISRTVLPQPASILDFLWYPAATVKDLASFCFVASIRECPVKLLDASDGRLRASYSITDHRERQVAPHSLAFNLNASKIYCGFEDAIEVFDIHRPGMDQGTRLSTTPSKKSKDGLKGIISALSFCPDSSADYFAAGTLTPSNFNIALFSESTGEKPLMWIGADGLSNSVTQLKFNPTNPSLIYASFRRQPEIYSWDLRYDVSKPLQIFRSSETKAFDTCTNQKMVFDVDLGGKWLSVGDQKGNISVFDLHALPTEGTEFVSPILTYAAHSDGIGSVAFHPLQSLLLSVSGSRHFAEEESSSEESGDEIIGNSVKVKRRLINPLDATVKLWGFEGR